MDLFIYIYLSHLEIWRELDWNETKVYSVSGNNLYPRIFLNYLLFIDRAKGEKVQTLKC